MSVRREKSKAICYISGHYRKPAHLKAELQGVINNCASSTSYCWEKKCGNLNNCIACGIFAPVCKFLFWDEVEATRDLG